MIKPLKKENKQTINKVNLMCIIIQSRAGLFKAGLRKPRVSAKFQFRNSFCLQCNDLMLYKETRNLSVKMLLNRRIRNSDDTAGLQP